MSKFKEIKDVPFVQETNKANSEKGVGFFFFGIGKELKILF